MQKVPPFQQIQFLLLWNTSTPHKIILAPAKPHLLIFKSSAERGHPTLAAIFHSHTLQKGITP